MTVGTGEIVRVAIGTGTWVYPDLSPCYFSKYFRFNSPCPMSEVNTIGDLSFQIPKRCL